MLHRIKAMRPKVWNTQREFQVTQLRSSDRSSALMQEAMWTKGPSWPGFSYAKLEVLFLIWNCSPSRVQTDWWWNVKLLRHLMTLSSTVNFRLRFFKISSTVSPTSSPAQCPYPRALLHPAPMWDPQILPSALGVSGNSPVRFHLSCRSSQNKIDWGKRRKNKKTNRIINI